MAGAAEHGAERTRDGARLAAHNLACRRGDRVLFAALELSLRPGDILHVTGANGIGKSSLLRLLAGLSRPFAGTVSRIGAVGLLDERPALDPALPLGRALGFWSAVDDATADLAGRATALLGLDDLLDVPVRYLSTGQRKRAGLARLIAQSAPIWLLDEPLNGLDAAAAAVVAGTIAHHGQGGGICVVASHQPLDVGRKQVLALADHAP